jgi:hypothetical protein
MVFSFHVDEKEILACHALAELRQLLRAVRHP